jgi:hypothetical protein
MFLLRDAGDKIRRDIRNRFSHSETAAEHLA